MSFSEFKKIQTKELKSCVKCNTIKEVSKEEVKENTIKSMNELKEELDWLFKQKH